MKKVVWTPPSSIHNPKKQAGQYGSFKELVQKANRVREEQEQAQAYLHKAMPAMLKLLEMRLQKGEALRVMRPIRYQTSKLQSELQKSEYDDGFYNNPNRSANDKFVDVVETVLPGTQLVLKALDPNLREFIFQDGGGKEYAIPFETRNQLMTQTDVFETVRGLFEDRGE